MKKKLLFLTFAALSAITLSSTAADARTYHIKMKLGDTRVVTASEVSPTYPAVGLVLRTFSWLTSNDSVATTRSTGTSTTTITAEGVGTASIKSRQSLTYDRRVGTMIQSHFETQIGDEYEVTVVDPNLALTATLPEDGEMNADTDIDIQFEYNDDSLSEGSGFDSISLWDDTARSAVSIVTGRVSGTLELRPTEELKPGHTYTATVPAGAIANSFDGTSDEAQTITFRTRIAALEATAPADGSTNVSENSPVTLTYADPVTVGSNSDAITIADESGNTIPYTVSVSGEQFIITPLEPYSYDTKYTVTVPAGAVANEEGMDEEESHTISFTVKSGIPAVSSSSPANSAADVPLSSVLRIDFDCPVERGGSFGDITLVNKDTGRSVEGDVELNSPTLTFIPASDLEYSSNYELTIPSDALLNPTGEGNRAYILGFRSVSADSEIIEPPVLTQEHGTLTITAMNDASVFYTTDGTSPDRNGIRYDGPVYLDKSCLVRAVAVKNSSVSPEAAYEYRAYIRSGCSAFGGEGSDIFEDIITLSDGSLLALGYSGSSSFGNGDWDGISAPGSADAILVKYDKDLNVIWKKHFGGADGFDQYNSAVALDDGGFIAVGYSHPDGFGTGDWEDQDPVDYETEGSIEFDNIIVRYDADGNIIWKQVFDTLGWDELNDIIATDDGCFVAVGFLATHCAYMVKFDRDGNILWRTEFGLVYSHSFKSVVSAEDGCIIAVGYCAEESFSLSIWDGAVGHGGQDAIIVKYGPDGEIIWKKHFGGAGNDCFNAVTAVADGGYVVSGFSNGTSFGNGDWEGFEGTDESNAIVVKYDSEGNIVWKLRNGGSSEIYYYNDIIENSSGELIACGQAGDRMFIVKYNSNGEQQWDSFPDQSGLSELHGLSLSGGDLYAVGQADSDFFENEVALDAEFRGGNYDSVIMKYDFSEVETSGFETAGKEGVISVTGFDTVSPGETIFCPVFFMHDADVSAANIQINYPSCLSYVGNKSDHGTVYVNSEETNYGGTLTLSCDFNNRLIPAGTSCVITQLEFKVKSDAPLSSHSVTIDPQESFIMDSSYAAISFEEAENYTFTVQTAIPKNISIIGSSLIDGASRYTAALYPSGSAGSSLEWSVSDDTAASIDENGLLTPLKNGTVTIRVYNADSGLSAEKEIEARGIASYVNRLSTDAGYLVGGSNERVLSKVLYVPDGATSVNITAEYTSGSLMSDNGILFSGIPKEFELTALPQTITLTKRADGCNDSVYTITIKPESSRTEHIIDNITADAENGMIYADVIISSSDQSGILAAAAYDRDGSLLRLGTYEYSGESNVALPFDLTGAAAVRLFIWNCFDNMLPISSVGYKEL